MSEKRELNDEQLERVLGGVLVGNERIVECVECGTKFNPDEVERGEDEEVKIENGAFRYPTYMCPQCKEFKRINVIQILAEDRKINF